MNLTEPDKEMTPPPPPLAPPVPPLSLRLFGPMETHIHGKPLPTLRTFKGNYLLALLALKNGAPVEREWLASTLWPESFDLKARYNLRRCLSDLRDSLGTEADRLVSPSVRTLSLDLDGAMVDLVTFDHAVSRASASRNPALLENAVALYRGPLLEGCNETWAETERIPRAEWFLSALETLAHRGQVRGDLHAAAGYLRRAVAAEPARESAQRALMQLLADAGDQAAVIETFRALRVYLRDRLNIEPSRETRALYQDLTERASVVERGEKAFRSGETGPHPPFPLPPLMGEGVPVSAFSPIAEACGAALLDTEHSPASVCTPSPINGGKGKGDRGPASPLPDEAQPGGAMALDSPFYLERAADQRLREALRRGDGMILLKGPRQIGKTSLLARGLHVARESGCRVAITDLQTLGDDALHSADSCLRALTRHLARQLQVPTPVWDSADSPGENCERFLTRDLLSPDQPRLVWALDELDSLFPRPFGSEVFALFRSWFNARALDPSGAWQRMTLVVSYATEAHLFITDQNQSPFNVGTRLTLADFSRDEVRSLARLRSLPLTDLDSDRLWTLLGGHPFLTQQAMTALGSGEANLASLEAAAARDDETLFSNHLRRLLRPLRDDAALRAALGKTARLDPDQFYRLRSAGVLTGETAETARLRCGLYETYLHRQVFAPDSSDSSSSGAGQ